jgi:FSR family fosmidomycin resistance protein-like MFS transporter
MTATHTLTHVFQRIHLALFPLIRTEFNLSIQQLGIIAAIPPLCQAILYIPAGLLSDRIGSKLMILLSLSIATLGTFLASLALNPSMLILAVSLVYVNITIYHPASYSFTTRLFTSQIRPKALGIHGAGGTLGMSIGPISISILIGVLALGWRSVYFFWCFPLLFGFISVLLIRSNAEKGLEKEQSEAKIKDDSILTLNLIVFLLFIAIRTMGGQIFSAFFPIYLVDSKGLNEALSSLIYGSSTFMGPLAAPLGGVLASKFGEKRWLLTALTLSYFSLCIALIVPNLFLFIALYILSGFFNFLGMAANSSIMAKLSPSRSRGLGYSLFFLPGSIMGAVAPMIAAQIANVFGFNYIFILTIAIYIIALVILKIGVQVPSKSSL